MNSIDTILKYIHESNDFVVTSHVNPDGDNIGSTLSIYYFLKKMNKNVFKYKVICYYKIKKKQNKNKEKRE